MAGTRSSRKRAASSSGSKRKSSTAATNAKGKKQKMFKASKKKNATPRENADAMFQELLLVQKNEEEEEETTDVLHLEGIAALADKLGLDAETDLKVVVLLWKINPAKPGCLTRKEWMNACTGDLDVTRQWESLMDQVPSWDIGFLTGDEFKAFYKFCFQFNRQGTHKTLDKELVVALLQLVLVDRVPSDRLTSFCDFLSSMEGAKEQQYSKVTLDQWTGFWDFCVECEDLSLYDESSSAWPVLIDEYVEYMEEKMKQ